jgi:glycerol-3-phosphate dehydrogenase
MPDVLLDRQRFLAEIETDPEFDALIVGGGIAGAATFRDLSLQGVRCLLVDRADFAGEASGALTRMAQGGFRYLQNGEFALVQRAATERDLFIAAAPHQARPLRLVIPCESLFGGGFAAAARALKLSSGHSLPGVAPLRLGVALYQWLSRATSILPSGGLMSGSELRRRHPGIARRYRGAAYVFEGLIGSPERVAVELLEDGVAASGRSAALNYAELTGDGPAGVTVRDALSGAELGIQTRVIVNAAGANVDRVARTFGVDGHRIDGVGGTHLLLRSPAIAAALGDDLLFFEDGDSNPQKRRFCLAYTVVDGAVLLGTTETSVADPDQSKPTQAEDAYLLAALRRLFPDAPVSPADIFGRMHGVRPLVASADADLTGRSRDHAIHVDRARSDGKPLVSIAGGKWTTFRAIGEDAANAALHELQRDRMVSTARLPIGGGRDGPKDAADRRRHRDDLVLQFGLQPDIVDRLIAVYGSRAARVASYLSDPDARRTISGTPLTVGEVRFFADEEMAVTADDVARRRTRLFLEGLATSEVLEEIDRVISERAESGEASAAGRQHAG